MDCCPFCKSTFFRERHSKQKYCKPSHKTMASKTRRAAAVATIQQTLELTTEAAQIIGDKLTMADITRKLHRWGYVYDEFACAWVKQAAVLSGSEIVQ